MKYERRHYAYTPIKGGTSVPDSRLINDLDTEDSKMAIHYIGTFSEYNPIHYKRNVEGLLASAVVKSSTSLFCQKEFNCHGQSVKNNAPMAEPGHCNLSLSLNKQELLLIANAMDDSDVFNVSYYNK